MAICGHSTPNLQEKKSSCGETIFFYFYGFIIYVGASALETIRFVGFVVVGVVLIPVDVVGLALAVLKQQSLSECDVAFC